MASRLKFKAFAWPFPTSFMSCLSFLDISHCRHSGLFAVPGLLPQHLCSSCPHSMESASVQLLTLSWSLHKCYLSRATFPLNTVSKTGPPTTIYSLAWIYVSSLIRNGLPR